MVIAVHEHPRVEKYLVIRKGGYLALESHTEKDERLEVQEGAGLILSRRAGDQPLTVQVLAPGDRFHFEPGSVHCLIGSEDLLVFERSIDPKGMDQATSSSSMNRTETSKTGQTEMMKHGEFNHERDEINEINYQATGMSIYFRVFRPFRG